MRAWNSTLPTRREKPRRKAQDRSAVPGATSLPRGPFRSAELRSLAAVVPCCMHCQVTNVGQVVLAHSGLLADGKGMGQKAHDVPCYLCGHCHDLLDGRAGHLTPAEKELFRLRATYRSVAWCLKVGALQVAA